MEDKLLIVASHKLFLGLPDAVGFARHLLAALEGRRLSLEIAVSPSMLNLAHVADVLRYSPVAVAAQNVHQEGNGAFTGQVSLEELLALRVDYVVIGHSEVLAHQHDGAETLANKIQWCVRHGVRPIVCVTDRGSGEDQAIAAAISSSLRELLSGSLCDASPRAVPLIAYEPSPAVTCDTPEGRRRVKHIVAGIREEVGRMLESHSLGRPLVLYGGGVNQGNVRTLLAELDADGFLVGRASVNISSFLDIVDAAEEAIAAAHASMPVPR